MINLHLGDSRIILQTLADNSVDAIVTDPPYGLSKEPDMMEVLRHWLNGDDYTHTGSGFMGKSWDSFVPGPAIWKECLRVLKPGGHLLAFFGSRTYDIGTLAIRLAGFEIRDQLMWIYGSGFPKSLDVSKALDKAAGAEREVVGRYQPPNGKAWNLTADEAVPGYSGGLGKRSDSLNITAPSSIDAQQWDGWGTALKPAHEPIVLARKPLTGTVAQNILTHGTGGLNIDATRVEFAGDADQKGATWGRGTDIMGGNFVGATHTSGKTNIEANPQGRFPANVLHDGSEEVLESFDRFGEKTSGQPIGVRKAANNIYGPLGAGTPITGYGDTGSAARFFYCAKADRTDRDEGCRNLDSKKGGMNSNTSGQHITRRDEGYTPSKVKNNHPTVKPTDLMQWLCRLITPPGGMILDPYMGSGTTGKAAMKEGFRFTGIELDPDYFLIAETRINHAKGKYGAKQMPLW